MVAKLEAVVGACLANQGISDNGALQSVRDYPLNRATTNSMMPIVATFQTSERASGTPPT
jgi:hypothetical protein